MATQAIRNLINQSDKVLFEVKNKLKEEKDKGLIKLQEQLPTPEEITSRVKAESCSTKTSNLVDKNFNNVKDKLNYLKDKLNQGIEKLQSLEQKIEKIFGWIEKIKEILRFLDPIISILDKIIKVLPKALGFLSGLAANGFAIKKLSDLIDLAKSKIETLNATIKTFKQSVIRFLDKLNPFDDIYTQLSCDTKGSYFNQWLNTFQPNRVYKILIKVKYEDKQEIIYDDNFEFKIVR